MKFDEEMLRLSKLKSTLAKKIVLTNDVDELTVLISEWEEVQEEIRNLVVNQ